MSDGRIPAINIALPAVATAAQSQNEIISLPPNLAQNAPLKGEVTDVKNGQITIQTDQGPIVLKTDLPLQVGQNINLKLQMVAQNATGHALTELLLTLDPKARPVATQAMPAQPAQQTPTQAITLSSLAQEFDQVAAPSWSDVDLPDVPKENIQILSAKSIVLPQAMTDKDLEQLIRTILNLPASQPLPQTLREGVDKLKTLLPLLGAPLQLQQAEPNPDIPHIQTTLVSLFQPGQKPDAVKALLSQLPNLPLLLTQAISPGQAVSPELVNTLKQLIQSLQHNQVVPRNTGQNLPSEPAPEVSKTNAQPFNAKPDPVTGKSLLSAALTNLLGKIVPQKTDVSMSQTPLRGIYQPMLGLALGQATNLITVSQVETAEKMPMLLFMVAPNGQNQVSLVMPQDKTPSQNPLVPGTVVIAAMDQKAQQVTLASVLPNLPTTQTVIPALHPSLSETWPALDRIWQAALQQQVMQPDVINLLRQTIPAPVVQQMPAAALFFFAILKNGALPHWVGDHVPGQSPLSEKAALVAQLGRDIQTLRAALTDNVPTDAWRPIPMPLIVNDQLHRLQWFFRQQDDVAYDHENVDAYQRKKRTRFLLDVPKTSFGDLQIDGLVQEKSLDVILRTENDLKKPMQDAIQQRYQRALETSSFAGGLIFQSGRQHYIHA